MENLRVLRKNLHKTQAEMAKELNMSRATYARYEGGVAFPSVENLLEMAKYFGCSVDYLLDHTFSQKLTEKQKLVAQKIETLDDFECEKILSFLQVVRSARKNF